MSKRALSLLLLLVSCTQKTPVRPPLPVAIPELEEQPATGLREISPQHTTFKVQADAGYTVHVFTGVDDKRAKALMKQKLFLIQSLFKEEKSPYPGMTSNVIKCPPQFLPVKSEKDNSEQTVLRLQLYANSRRVNGVCSAADVKYKSVYLFVYCKHSRTAVQVEGFSENKEQAEWPKWLVAGACR